MNGETINRILDLLEKVGIIGVAYFALCGVMTIIVFVVAFWIIIKILKKMR